MTELPKGWHETVLGDVCVKVEKTKPEGFKRETFTYIDIGSINSARNAISNPQIFKVHEAPSRARQLLSGGDTVFSTVRPYLRKIENVGRGISRGSGIYWIHSAASRQSVITTSFPLYLQFRTTYSTKYCHYSRERVIPLCETVTCWHQDFPFRPLPNKSAL